MSLDNPDRGGFPRHTPRRWVPQVPVPHGVARQLGLPVLAVNRRLPDRAGNVDVRAADLIPDLETIRRGAAAGATAYQKPAAGIPRPDFEIGVRASLDKADSAVQPGDILSGGKVKSDLLPSYVDDVIEVANYASLPDPGEEGKIYVALDTNIQYRWSGTKYTEIAKMIIPSTSAPLVDGAASAGSSEEYSRGDHVHPTDTSRASVEDVTLAERRFSAWTILRDGVDVTNQVSQQPSFDENVVGAWFIGDSVVQGDESPVPYAGGEADATSLAWYSTNNNQYVATRTALLGYQLGSQEDKPLASEAEAEALRRDKADKPATFTEGNLAKFDANGNPMDSGKKAEDFATKDQIDEGWWSEWTVTAAGWDDVTLEWYDVSGTRGWVPFHDGSRQGVPKGTYEGSTSLTWTGDEDAAVDITATRHRVAAPVPTKPEDIGALPASSVVAPSSSATAGQAADAKATGDVLEPLLFAQYYPDGSVKSAAEFTEGIKYDDPDTTNRTITVKPFCNTGDSDDDNSGLVGRVVIPPFVDAQGNPYISDDGTRFKVVGVSGTSSLFTDDNTTLTSIITPCTVTIIGNGAFITCTSLTSASLPATTTVGHGVFNGCTSLSSVSLSAVTSLGFDAFSDCTSLLSVSLSAVTNIGERAFRDCTSLASVDFGDTPRSSVPTLGDSNAFSGVPTSCKIIVPYTQYDAWIAADGWRDLPQEFVRHTEKADKPATFTAGNLAKFDSNGNPIDSGMNRDANGNLNATEFTYTQSQVADYDSAAVGTIINKANTPVVLHSGEHWLVRKSFVKTSSGWSVDSVTGRIIKPGATGVGSTAWGEATAANGNGADSEGKNTRASGAGAHAEGQDTDATATCAHSEGLGTKAQNLAEHAQGQYNASHTGSTNSEKTLHSIGIGTADNARKNAVEVMQDGKTYIYELGGYDGTNPTSATDFAALVNGKLGKMEAIAWSDLKTLRDGGNLVPGQQYRITDYVATTSGDMDSRSANHPFDIIVTADAPDKLNEAARAVVHDGDLADDEVDPNTGERTKYFAGCDLAAWKLMYCLDNDTSRFAWAVADGQTDAVTGTGGRGVIYRMVDEFNNDFPYDFKGIQFQRWAITQITSTTLSADAVSSLSEQFVYSQNGGKCFAYQNGNISVDFTVMAVDANTSAWYFTFDTGNGEDGSKNGYDNSVYGNKAGESVDATKMRLNNIVFLGDGCNSNTFGDYCYSNTFGNKCYSNTFGNGCYSNTFGDYCSSNTFGVDCNSNTFGDSCISNTFGNGCNSNTFGDSCYYNTFGDSCISNTFGDGCYSNTFGNGCYSNTFGDYCYSNTFGDYCYSNTFGNECYSNTFGNGCYSNTFGDYCSSNTFGVDCNSNTFGTGFVWVSFDYYVSYNAGTYFRIQGVVYRMVAPYKGSFSTAKQFEADDRLYYATTRKYYKCVVAHRGAWDGSHFEEVPQFGEGGVLVEDITVVKSYYRYITFQSGIQYVALDCPNATSSAFYQNVELKSGVAGSQGNPKLITDTNVNQDFHTTYKPANSQEIPV